MPNDTSQFIGSLPTPDYPWVWIAVVAVLTVIVVLVVYLLKRAFTRTNKVMAIVERKRLEAQSTVMT